MRYIVIKPTPGGYCWFDIKDTKFADNDAVVTVYSGLLDAESIANDVCARLNNS